MGKVYIKIESALYFYYGSTQPTAENYKTIGTQVTEYPAVTDYVAPFARLYILVASNKTVQLYDPEGDADITTIEDTTVSIPGHKVFRSSSKVSDYIQIKIY